MSDGTSYLVDEDRLPQNFPTHLAIENAPAFRPGRFKFAKIAGLSRALR